MRTVIYSGCRMLWRSTFRTPCMERCRTYQPRHLHLWMQTCCISFCDTCDHTLQHGTRCSGLQRLRCSATSESSILLRTLTYVCSCCARVVLITMLQKSTIYNGNGICVLHALSCCVHVMLLISERWYRLCKMIAALGVVSCHHNDTNSSSGILVLLVLILLT